VDDTRTLSTRKKNGGLVSKTPATNFQKTSSVQKSILKSHSPADAIIETTSPQETCPPPSVVRRSNSGSNLRDRRRSKVFSLGGNEEMMAAAGASLLLNPNEPAANSATVDVNKMGSSVAENPVADQALPPKPPKSIFKHKQTNEPSIGKTLPTNTDDISGILFFFLLIFGPKFQLFICLFFPSFYQNNFFLLEALS
jgi:hypothetical protein